MSSLEHRGCTAASDYGCAVPEGILYEAPLYGEESCETGADSFCAVCALNSSVCYGATEWGSLRSNAFEVMVSTVGSAGMGYVVEGEVCALMVLFYVFVLCLYVEGVEFAAESLGANPLHFGGGVLACNSETCAHFGESAGAAG